MEVYVSICINQNTYLLTHLHMANVLYNVAATLSAFLLLHFNFAVIEVYDILK